MGNALPSPEMRASVYLSDHQHLVKQNIILLLKAKKDKT